MNNINIAISQIVVDSIEKDGNMRCWDSVFIKTLLETSLKCSMVELSWQA